jgi:hypothetical protein
MIKPVVSVLAMLVLCCALAAPADAQSALSAWVSGHGIDKSGCGAVTAPCRTLQFAHDKIVAAGGEIDILDPANYGYLAINKAINVINDGVGDAIVSTPTAGTIALKISANPVTDAVFLKGLVIEGTGGGLDGVYVESAAKVTITNCVARGFKGDGIVVAPQIGLALPVSILNTTVSGNNVGIEIAPISGAAAPQVVINQVSAVNNSVEGILVDSRGSNTSLTISNSVLSNNYYGILIQPQAEVEAFAAISQTTATSNYTGFYVSGVNASATIVDSVASDNTNAGFAVAIAGASLTLGHDVATGNGTGVFIGAKTVAATYGDNRIISNHANFSGAFTATLTTK